MACEGAANRGLQREARQIKMLCSPALDHMPFEITSMAERELWLFDYLRAKTMLMKASTNVQSPFAWLRQAVAEDWT